MKTLFVLPSLKTNKQHKNNITLIFLNNCEVKTCVHRSRKKSESATKSLCKSLSEDRRVEFKLVNIKSIFSSNLVITWHLDSDNSKENIIIVV